MLANKRERQAKKGETHSTEAYMVIICSSEPAYGSDRGIQCVQSFQINAQVRTKCARLFAFEHLMKCRRKEQNTKHAKDQMIVKHF